MRCGGSTRGSGSYIVCCSSRSSGSSRDGGGRRGNGESLNGGCGYPAINCISIYSILPRHLLFSRRSWPRRSMNFYNTESNTVRPAARGVAVVVAVGWRTRRCYVSCCFEGDRLEVD